MLYSINGKYEPCPCPGVRLEPGVATKWFRTVPK